jgi:hypothetical protein
LSGFSYRALEQELNQLYDTTIRNAEAYSRQNRALAENIKSYSTWASGVEGAAVKVAENNEELVLREFILSKNIERNEELIKSEETSAQQKARLIVKNRGLVEQLHSVQEALRATRKYVQELNDEDDRGGDGPSLFNRDAMLKMRQWQQLGEKSLDTVLKLGSTLKEMDFSSMLAGMDGQSIIDATEAFNRKITGLRNDLAADMIDQQAFERQAEQAARAFMEKLKAVWKSLPKELKKALGRDFEQAFGAVSEHIENAGESSEEFSGTLDDIADAASAVLNLADAFGEVDESTQKTLRGVIDIVRNIDNLKGASGLGLVAPALGIGAGLVSFFSGIVSSGTAAAEQKTMEEINELQRSIDRNRRALDRNTAALTEQAVVASEASRSELAAINETFGELKDLAITSWLSPQGSEQAKDQLSLLQDQLEAAGIDIGVDLVKHYEDLLESGMDPAKALQQVLGLSRQGGSFFGWFETIDGGLADTINTITQKAGEYGESLGAAIQEFEDMIRFGGYTVGEAMDVFAQNLSELGHEIPPEVLAELASFDLTTEEGLKAFKQWLEKLWTNRHEWMGEMTPEQYRNLLGFMESQADATMGDSGGGVARSTQIARTITEVQANEVIVFLERIEYWTRIMAARMGDQTAIVVTQSGGALPKISIPIPLPVRVENDWKKVMEALSSQNKAVAGATTNNNVTVHVNAPGGMSDADIDEISREFTRQLRRERDSKQF